MADAAAQNGSVPGARERHPLVEMLIIAAPTVATMTSYTLMQFVDKVMVSKIGPDPVYVGAQGNGGFAAWVPIAVAMGLLTVINSYVSQNLGAGKADRAPAYAWTGLWIAAASGLLVLPYAFGVGALFRAMGHEGRQLELETGYAQIMIAGSFLTLGTRAIAQYFYGMHRPWVVLVAGLAGNVTNLVLNSFLIYGATKPVVGDPGGLLDAWFTFAAGLSERLGVPALGIAGAGYATLVGLAVELSIPLAVFLSAKYHRLYRTRTQWRPSWPHIRDVLKIGWPGGLMFGNEMICWFFFMVYLVGGFEPKEVNATAGWIAHQWMTLSFMPAVGISIACTAMVGKAMGMKRPDLAAQRAWMGLAVSMVYMGFCGACFVIFREPMVAMFVDGGTPPETQAMVVSLGARFLIAAAAFQLFDGIAMSLSGALRGAGDTVWTGVVTLVLSWAVIVLGGLAMVRFFPELGSVGPWIAASSYIIILSLVILARFLSGKWKTMTLLEGSATSGAATVAVAAGPVDGVTPDSARASVGP